MLKRRKKKETQNAVFHTSEVVFLIIATSIVSCFMGILCAKGYRNYDDNIVEVKDEKLKEIVNNYQYIIDNYYKEFDKDALVKGAINGMIESLGDQFSMVIDDENLDNFNRTLNGWFKGLGIEISNNDDGNVFIASVFDDSSASRKGLEVGDVIISINGINFEGKTFSEVADYIKKDTVDTVDLVILRDGVKKSFNGLKKEKVILKSVVKEVFERNDKKVGYLYVSTFSGTTYDQFKTTLEELEKDNIDSLIIDMRNNSGGHLTAAEKILSLFLNKKHVIYQVETKSNKVKVYATGTADKKYSVAILQNGATASAAEIVSSALKEEYGATVIGDVSFGKGTIQELVNGSTEYKVTTKKWLTPKGDWINEIGVEPNIKVDLSEEYKNSPSYETDNQLQTALDTLTK